MFREGCRVARTWLRGGAGPFSAQAPPDSSASRTIAPEFGPRGHNSLSRRVLPTAAPSLSRLKRWQKVVCYIPEGRLLRLVRVEHLGRGAGRVASGIPEKGQRRAGLCRGSCRPRV